jgi:hypothetical protein
VSATLGATTAVIAANNHAEQAARTSNEEYTSGEAQQTKTCHTHPVGWGLQLRRIS